MRDGEREPHTGDREMWGEGEMMAGRDGGREKQG